MTAQERATEFFSDETEFRDWLESNHAVSEGVWLKFAKKGTGIVSLNHALALDVALCYGWIDGRAKSSTTPTTYRASPRAVHRVRGRNATRTRSPS